MINFLQMQQLIWRPLAPQMTWKRMKVRDLSEDIEMTCHMLSSLKNILNFMSSIMNICVREF